MLINYVRVALYAVVLGILGVGFVLSLLTLNKRFLNWYIKQVLTMPSRIIDRRYH